MGSLANKRILLGVTGGIAAYKSADLTRRLREAGAEVRVVMTDAACEFITELTMQAVSGHPVHRKLLDTERGLDARVRRRAMPVHLPTGQLLQPAADLQGVRRRRPAHH